MLRVSGDLKADGSFTGCSVDKTMCDPAKMQGGSCGFEVYHSRYIDFKSAASYIYRNEGWLAFTKGVLPRMSINVPATALSWGTYEMMKSFLEKYSKD